MSEPARILVADLPVQVQEGLRADGVVSLRLLQGGVVEMAPSLVRTRQDPSALFGRVRVPEPLTDEQIEAGIAQGATEGW